MIATAEEIAVISTNIGVIATYWLSYQFVMNPRQYNDQEVIRKELHASSRHIISMMRRLTCAGVRVNYSMIWSAANCRRANSASFSKDPARENDDISVDGDRDGDNSGRQPS